MSHLEKAKKRIEEDSPQLLNQKSITEKVTEHTIKELEEIEKEDNEKLHSKKIELLKIDEESNRRIENIKELMQVRLVLTYRQEERITIQDASLDISRRELSLGFIGLRMSIML